jgi:pimeloyl-ACP methyl ester carboxylesterase
LKTRFLYLFFCGFVWLSVQAKAQKRHPVTHQLVPIQNTGDYLLEDGTLFGYQAKFGIINHSKGTYGLRFVMFESLESNPWLVILNGGPGRTNIRLPFEIDSILSKYNLLLPGYRGVDDGAYENLSGRSDSTIEAFIRKNRTTYSTQKLVDDVMLICEMIHIDSFYIAAHSYGTIVGRTLYEANKENVTGLFEFSPVMESAPIPNPESLEFITQHVADSLNVSLTAIEDTLNLWMQAPQKRDLAMGLIASFYVYNDAVTFFLDVLSGKLTRANVSKKGREFLQFSWLMDYGMKFNRMPDIDLTGCDIYTKISHLFYLQVSKYLPSDAPVVEHRFVSEGYMPCAVSFIPKYEIFHTCSGKQIYNVLCECGHADLWKMAPYYIFEYRNSINPQP